jgi:hypothetical protein
VSPEKRPLFRPEAVEHHARARVGGRTLDLKEKRTIWLFRGLLLVMLLAVLAAFVVRVDVAGKDHDPSVADILLGRA